MMRFATTPPSLSSIALLLVMLALAWTSGVSGDVAGSPQPLSIPRNNLAAVRVGSRVVFAGGGPVTGPTAQVDVYHLKTDVWTSSGTALSSPRALLSYATYNDELVFFAGGTNTVSGPTATIDLYNATSDTWRHPANLVLSSPRVSVAVLVVGSKIIFAGGGTTGSSVPSATFDILLDAKNSTITWLTGNLTVPRMYTTAVTVVTPTGPIGLIVGGRCGLAAGAGCTGPNAQKSSLVELYNGSTGAWSAYLLPPHIAALGQKTSGASIGAIAVFATGEIPCANVTVYNGTSNAWYVLVNALSQLRGAASIGVSGNHIFFAGGLAQSSMSGAIDIFDVSVGNLTTGAFTGDPRRALRMAVPRYSLGVVSVTPAAQTVSTGSTGTGVFANGANVMPAALYFAGGANASQLSIIESMCVADCSAPPNQPCVIQACQNGGYCMTDTVPYRCVCPDTFTGTACTLDVNECATNNGGCGPPSLSTCTNAVGSWQCTPYITPGSLSSFDPTLSDVPLVLGGNTVQRLRFNMSIVTVPLALLAFSIGVAPAYANILCNNPHSIVGTDFANTLTYQCRLGAGYAANYTLAIKNSQTGVVLWTTNETVSFPPPMFDFNSLIQNRTGYNTPINASFVALDTTAAVDLQFTGQYFPPVASGVVITYGPASAPGLYPCAFVVPYCSSTVFTCTVDGGPQNTDLFFQIASANYRVVSPFWFSIPATPDVVRVSGCPIDVGNGTTACPTRGGTVITIYGINFQQQQLSVAVGGVHCLNPTVASPVGALQTITCTLVPTNGGVASVIITSQGQTSAAVQLVAFAAPVVYSVEGCTATASPVDIANCPTIGGSVITLNGDNFGQTPPIILIGTSQCVGVELLVPHTTLACTTPSGTGADRPILVLQGGQLCVNASVSYVACQSGTFVTGLTCTPCAESTAAGGLDAVSCQACGQGTYSNHSGSSECVDCDVGTYQDRSGQTACLACSGNQYQLSRGQSSCFSCAVQQYWNAVKSVCDVCPLGATCSATDGVQADPGFFVYRQADGSLDSIGCQPGYCDTCSNTLASNVSVFTCCGDNRKPASENPLCGECIDGPYYTWGQSCILCEKANPGLLFGFIVVTWIYVTIFHRLSQMSSADTRILINYLQFVFIYMSTIAGSLTTWLSLFNANVFQSGGSTCVAPLTDLQRLASGLFVPCAGFLFLMINLGLTRLVWTIMKRHQCCCSCIAPNYEAAAAATLAVLASQQSGLKNQSVGENRETARQLDRRSSSTAIADAADPAVLRLESAEISDRVSFIDGVIGWTELSNVKRFESVVLAYRRTLLAFLGSSYPSFAQTTWTFFSCISYQEDTYLQAYPSVSCSHNSVYLNVAPLFYILLIAVVALPPLMFLRLWWLNRQGILFGDPTTRVLYGIWCETYTPARYTWEAYIMFRRLVVAILALYAGFQNDNSLRFTYLCFANVCFMGIHFVFKPFRLIMDNYFETLSLITLTILTLFLSAAPEPVSSSYAVGLTVMCFVVGIVFLASVVNSRYTKFVHARNQRKRITLPGSTASGAATSGGTSAGTSGGSAGLSASAADPNAGAGGAGSSMPATPSAVESAVGPVQSAASSSSNDGVVVIELSTPVPAAPANTGSSGDSPSVPL